ncbi:thioredoxin family protein [Pelagibacterales bacterium SAG-MED31]|nr:thioredoxin family protein [Pelagibacterales bacterium SAG-MED31]
MPVNAVNDKLGWLAPDFHLKDVSENQMSLDQLRGENGTVVAFICNHCPYVIGIAERLAFEAKELKKLSINTIAIMSNDVIQYPEDSYEKMKIFSKKYNFNFPYLYDETQEVAKNYGAVCTPDIFGFNSSLKLSYRGRIDSGVMKSDEPNIKRELYDAMVKIKKYDEGPIEQFNSFGCSIKWKSNGQ